MKKIIPKEGLDLTGIGKVAKAIPAEVYERTSNTLCVTFEKLIAPITETTAGIGRYIEQKFNGMVEAEKAIATYSLEEAIQQAKSRGKNPRPPAHIKSFVLSLEHASKESNLYLHELWVNLLTSQITEDECHPHFVEVLSHLSPKEAHLLSQLLPKRQIGSTNNYLGYVHEGFKYWARENSDRNLQEWNYSCTLLIELGLAGAMAFTINGEKKKEEEEALKRATILFLTASGSAFLNTVKPSNSIN